MPRPARTGWLHTRIWSLVSGRVLRLSYSNRARLGNAGSRSLIRRSKPVRSRVRTAWTRASTVVLTWLSRELYEAVTLVAGGTGDGATAGAEQPSSSSVRAATGSRNARHWRDADTRAAYAPISAWPTGSGVRHVGDLDVLHRLAGPWGMDDLPIAGVKAHVMDVAVEEHQIA